MSPLLTATTTAEHSPWPLIVLAGLAALAVYLVACWIWPFATCENCKGTGKLHSPTGRAWRACRPCKGTGGQLRVGRRIIDLVNRLHRGA